MSRSGRPGKLYCTAAITKLGRTIIVCDATVRDSEGRDIATGTFTFYVTGEIIREDLS